MKRRAYMVLALAAITILFPRAGEAGHGATGISTSLEALTGTWESEGYGLVVEIQGGANPSFERYEVSDDSCLLIHAGSLENFHQDYERVLRNAESTRFTYSLSGAVTTYAYRRLDALPDQCINGGMGFDSDPLLNFDVLWATFEEHYAFFDQRGVSWNALRDQLRPQLSGHSTDAELFDVLVQLLVSLCDGHVGLDSGFASFNGEVNPECWGEMLQEVLADFGAQSQYADAYTYFRQVFRPAVLDIIVANYMQGSLFSAANGNILWGDLGGGIGYLNLLQMADYAGSDSSPGEDLEILGPVLDQLMTYLSSKVAVVIDIRLNNGGYDHVALDLASRFTDLPKIAFSKKTRWGEGFAEQQTSLMRPPGEAGFTRPVVILTSDLTASAAENFLLAMRELPNVTVIGETTVGVHSDVLERQLPNGWSFSLSNEVYQSAEGIVFEGKGIPPDIALKSLRADDRANGRDMGIEVALEELANPTLNFGLNDAWVNPDVGFQGMFITVFPDAGLLFLAWFTFDSELPPGDAEAMFGAPGQRWVTALGPYAQNRAVLKAELTSGGIFNAPMPAPSQDPNYGTITLQFNGCNDATVNFDFPTAGESGLFGIKRVLGDNAAVCEMLN